MKDKKTHKMPNSHMMKDSEMRKIKKKVLRKQMKKRMTSDGYMKV